jgi:hypothetical protein
MKLQALQYELTENPAQREHILAQVKQLAQDHTSVESGADASLFYLNEQPYNTPKAEVFDFVLWAQKTWPRSPLKTHFEDHRNRLLMKEATVEMTNVVEDPESDDDYDEQPTISPDVRIVVKHRNVGEATITIERIQHDENLDMAKWKVLGKEHTLQVDYTTDLIRSGRPEEFSTDTLRIMLAPGDYKATFKASGMQSSPCYIHVTSMLMLSTVMPDQKRLIRVVDAESGRPLPNVSIYGYSEGRRQMKASSPTQWTTDAEGRCFIDDAKVNYVQAWRTEIDYTERMYLRSRYSYDEKQEDENVHYALFTDRSIYRPGQTLHVAGFVYAQRGDDTRTLRGHQVRLQLRDANYQEVELKTLQTDEFGVFQADFVLPKDRMNGHFRLTANDQSRRVFRVEEYKLPTFSVEFLSLEEEYTYGDSVTIKGKAQTFSGAPVQNAQLKYEFIREQISFWRYYDREEEKLDAGVLTTDASGAFEINVFSSAIRTHPMTKIPRHQLCR